MSLLGVLAGVVLALAVGTGASTKDVGWTVTVDQSRDTLLGILAVIFTALIIVLALASVAAQNVVGRYGSRILHLYFRRSPERWVIASFALAAAFVMVEQFQLRELDPNGPAPIAGLVISILLLMVTATLMIAYISAVIRWFRVDRAANALQRAVVESARAVRRASREASTRCRSRSDRRPPPISWHRSPATWQRSTPRAC